MASRPFRIHYGLLLAAIPTSLLAAGLFVWTAWPQLQLLLLRTQEQLVPGCGCALAAPTHHDTLLFGALLVGAAVAIAFVAAFTVHLARHLYATRRFLSQLTERTVEWRRVAGRWVRVLHVESDVPLLFAHGTVRRCIVLSSTAVSLLSARELDSVLDHESFHVRRFHALHKALLYAFIDTLFFIPSRTALKQSIELAQECSADRFAMSQTHDRSLLSAFVRLVEYGKHAHPVAPAFAIMNERLRFLMNEEVRSPHRSLALSVVAGVAGITTAIALFVASGGAVFGAGSVDANEARSCIQRYEHTQTLTDMTYFNSLTCEEQEAVLIDELRMSDPEQSLLVR